MEMVLNGKKNAPLPVTHGLACPSEEIPLAFPSLQHLALLSASTGQMSTGGSEEPRHGCVLHKGDNFCQSLAGVKQHLSQDD